MHREAQKFTKVADHNELNEPGEPDGNLVDDLIQHGPIRTAGTFQHMKRVVAAVDDKKFRALAQPLA